MPAKDYICRVTRKLWITPTVFELEFEPSKGFRFEPGQFLSVKIPNPQQPSRPIRRAYSFSQAPGTYELCIKHVPGGPGSEYLANLEVGQTFAVSASYGDLFYEPKEKTQACFISTGTGIGPFKSIALSRGFIENPPDHAIQLFGARDESEILYRGLFESLGFEAVYALSNADSSWNGYRGRVTDYLFSLPSHWPWHATEFYLCGNGNMVGDIRRHLRNARGVAESSIHQEVYFSSKPASAEISQIRKAG